MIAKAPKLSVLGDPYSEVALCLNRKDDTACRPRPLSVGPEDLTACAVAKKSGGSCIVATAKRDGGGVLDATVAKLPATKNGKTVVPGKLGGAISIDLPLAVLDQFIGGSVHLGTELVGMVSQADIARALPDAKVGDLVGVISESPPNN